MDLPKAVLYVTPAAREMAHKLKDQWGCSSAEAVERACATSLKRMANVRDIEAIGVEEYVTLDGVMDREGNVWVKVQDEWYVPLRVTNLSRLVPNRLSARSKELWGRYAPRQAVLADQVLADARQLRISPRTVYRDKAVLGVQSRRRGFGKGSKVFWIMSEHPVFRAPEQDETAPVKVKRYEDFLVEAAVDLIQSHLADGPALVAALLKEGRAMGLDAGLIYTVKTKLGLKTKKIAGSIYFATPEMLCGLDEAEETPQ